MTEEQKIILEKESKRVDYLSNCRVNESQKDYEKRMKTLKLEIIKESTTPQPIEWELGEYYAIGGSYCGIENRIFVDENQSYKRHNHPLWVYVEFKEIKSKNPHAYYSCFYLPITVERRPRVIGDIEGLGISDEKIKKIKRFISGNVKWFQDIADQKIRGTKNKPVPIFMLKENKELLVEMANFSKDDLKLPVNVWFDPKRNKQHADRMKFQNDYGDNFNYNNCCSLRFHDGIVVGTPKLKNWEIDWIRKFCEINKKIIDLFNKNKIDRDGFIQQTTKIDNKGNPIKQTTPKQTIPNSTWTIKDGFTRFNISVVVSNSGQFNYLKNNNLLTNTWFDEANPFHVAGEKNLAFARSGDDWYQIDENGNVTKYM